jgi:hypothetical protein
MFNDPMSIVGCFTVTALGIALLSLCANKYWAMWNPPQPHALLFQNAETLSGKWVIEQRDNGVLCRQSPDGTAMPEPLLQRIRCVATQAKVKIGERVLVATAFIDFDPQ